MENLERTRKKAKQYWFNDGINEIGLGLVFLILGIYFFLMVSLKWTGLIRTIFDSSLLLVMLGTFWLINSGIKYFKENLTYPRTGFVSYERSRRLPKWVTGLIAGITGALIASLLARENLLRWLPALSGAVICLVLLLIAFRIQLFRFHILALLSLCYGLIFSNFEIEPMLGTSAVYSLCGISVLFSGVCILVTYIHSTSPPGNQSNE